MEAASLTLSTGLMLQPCEVCSPPWRPSSVRSIATAPSCGGARIKGLLRHLGSPNDCRAMEAEQGEAGLLFSAVTPMCRVILVRLLEARSTPQK